MSFDFRKLGQALFGKTTAKSPSEPVAKKAARASKPKITSKSQPEPEEPKSPLLSAIDSGDPGLLLQEIASLGNLPDTLTSHGSQRAHRLLELAQQLIKQPNQGLAVMVTLEAGGLTDDAMHSAAMWRSLSKKCLNALEIMDIERAKQLVPEMHEHLEQLKVSIEAKRQRIEGYSSNLEPEEIASIAEDAVLLSILEGQEIPLKALSGTAPHEVASRAIAQLKPIKLLKTPEGLEEAIKNRDLAAIKQIGQSLWA